METKPKRWLRVRKIIYYGLTLIVVVCLVGGLKALTIGTSENIDPETDMFVLNYVDALYGYNTEDETLINERRSYLQNASYEYKEVLNSDITISMLTQKNIKTKKVLDVTKEYKTYEYVVVMSYAFKTKENLETTQFDFSEKITVLRDTVAGGYTVIRATPFDYSIPIGMREETEKLYSEQKNTKTKLEGEKLDKSSQNVYVDQLKVFFDTYTQNLASAQALVSNGVRLAELTGTFDTTKLSINDGTSNQEKVYLLITVPYSIDGVLTFEKTYLITLQDRTIIEMEEI